MTWRILMETNDTCVSPVDAMPPSVYAATMTAPWHDIPFWELRDGDGPVTRVLASRRRIKVSPVLAVIDRPPVHMSLSDSVLLGEGCRWTKRKGGAW